MDTLIVLLVLLSAMLHASWNAFLRLAEDRIWLLGMMSIPYIAVSAIGVTVLPLPAPGAWPYIAASVVLEFGYCLALIRAYRSGDFGQIYPIARGLSPLLVCAGALVFAHESLKPLAATGVALVSIGIISLAFRRDMRFSGESVPYALLTGLFIFAYSVVDGIGARVEAYRYLPIAMVSALRELSSIFAVLIGWLVMREKLTTRRIVACLLVTLGAVLIRI